MRNTAIRLLLATMFAVLGACGSGEDTDAGPSTGVVSGLNPVPAADNPAAASDQTSSEPAASGIFPQVSRTREGNGGIIAVAGEMTMEFTFASGQGLCRASDGKFTARGIGINDDQASVSIEYAIIAAPDTGRIVGQVFFLEIRKDGYLPWGANSANTGAFEDISQDSSPGGGITLSVTGTVTGYQKNMAMTGIKAPYRLEATCDP